MAQSTNPVMLNFKYSAAVKKHLPIWVEIEKDRVGEKFVIDGDWMYPTFLNILGIIKTVEDLTYPTHRITVEDLELARLIMTNYLKREIVKKYGGPDAAMRIRITTDEKKLWRYQKFPRRGSMQDPNYVYKELKKQGKLDGL